MRKTSGTFSFSMLPTPETREQLPKRIVYEGHGRPTDSQTKTDVVEGSYTDHEVLSIREYKPSTSRFEMM